MARAASRDTAKQLYGISVAQARHEAFYTLWHVPDTLEGRFEMIVLHLFLAVERLQKEGAAGQELARSLMEAFVVDIDDHLREVGIADLKVPKHVKKAAAIAYDRFEDYGKAMKGAGKLDKLVLSNVYDHDGRSNAVGADEVAGAEGIACYMGAATAKLSQQNSAMVMAGQLTFPAPDEDQPVRSDDDQA